jgi:thiamine pyrophosphate-dependent acetolactate synthase large subunit-like protein
VELAERLGARVLTDLKTGATFPTQHALHPCAPGMFVGADGCALIRDADVILSLDWIDVGGALRLAGGGEWPGATLIHCSPDQYCHNGWSMDYQALPPADIALLASPDALVARLLERIAARAIAPDAERAHAEASPRAATAASVESVSRSDVSVDELARTTIDTLAPHAPSYIRLPIGWPGEACRFAHPLDYIGFDGGGGIGSGPGMAVGAALALQSSGRLPIAILGDGDYLMGLTAIWSGVHYGVPLLVVVANNHSFFNDELHQERTARVRERPVENRWIGMRMSDPVPDLAKLAQGQGAVGIGPVADVDGYVRALADAVARVKAGATVVIDVHVAPEYARAVSSAVVRHIPGER